ncbi:hypothetical protein BJY52DRAFT_1189147 [Lactarius psammicola]|nr:hypothetical protein BJY52DRAFT_1189147 [Lactarius psammicola]
MQNLLGAGAGAAVGLGGRTDMAAAMKILGVAILGIGMGMADLCTLVVQQQATMVVKQNAEVTNLWVAQQAMRDATDKWCSCMGMNMGKDMNVNLGVNPFGIPPTT